MQGNQPYMHPSQGSPWVIYIVRCRDGSYYTGITTDLQRRIEEHNSRETGAKYTRSRRPVILVYSESAPSRAVATQRENQIKKMNIADKKQVIAAGMPVKPIFTAKS
jgi:putative endonuclease